MQPTSVTNC